MTVHTQLDHLPIFRNAVITIGTFDGVHTGHQAILKQLQEEAALVNGETVIITFNPHPRRIVQNQLSEVRLLNTLSEKISLLENMGIGHLVIVPFTRAFADQPAIDYVTNFLVKYFRPHTIIIGYDHRFGHNREGNYHLLEDLKEQFNYKVKEIPEHILQDLTISSTKVRQSIINGHIEIANQFLGYSYFFEGVVVEGNRLGRTIGYPTANIRISDEEKLVPGNGVYAVDIRLPLPAETNTATISASPEAPFRTFGGMMNIGMRPTVNGTKRTIEVNIFDFDEDIYGATVRVYVKAWLRGEVKFSGLDALKDQLAKDKTGAMEKLER